MREVEIKKGTYGHRIALGRVQPITKGNKVIVPDEEAARLVGIGVAMYVDSPALAAKPPITLLIGDEGATYTTATEKPTQAATGGETDLPDGEDEVAKLERMTKGDLEQMAKDMGIDISSAKNNHERAVLIVAADADDNIHDSPVLGKEGIVL